MNSPLKSFLIGTLLLTGMLELHAAEIRQGHSEGNGGDAVSVNDDLVLRDFVEDESLSVEKDAIEFLRTVPDLKELLSDIGRMDPELELRFWRDYRNAKIVWVEGDLPSLPDNHTGSLLDSVDRVQLVIRFKNEIYVSRTQYARLRDAAYLWWHEALNSSLFTELPRSYMETMIHHRNVRQIVRYTRDNRTTLNKEDFIRFVDSIGYPFVRSGMDRAMADISANVAAAFRKSWHEGIGRKLIDGTLPQEDQCALEDLANSKVDWTRTRFCENCQKFRFIDFLHFRVLRKDIAGWARNCGSRSSNQERLKRRFTALRTKGEINHQKALAEWKALAGDLDPLKKDYSQKMRDLLALTETERLFIIEETRDNTDDTPEFSSTLFGERFQKFVWALDRAWSGQ